jgi:hypothetical protein
MKIQDLYRNCTTLVAQCYNSCDCFTHCKAAEEMLSYISSGFADKLRLLSLYSSFAD